MTRIAPRIAAVFLCLIFSLTAISQAQLAAGPGIADAATSQPVSTQTISFAGNLPGQLDGSFSMTFNLSGPARFYATLE
jgi:hypothetical protein